jgi:hypothetical protein
VGGGVRYYGEREGGVQPGGRGRGLACDHMTRKERRAAMGSSQLRRRRALIGRCRGGRALERGVRCVGHAATPS